jgi:hypothetical protein
VLFAYCRLIYAALFDLAGCVVSAKSGGSEISSSLSVSPEMPALKFCTVLAYSILRVGRLARNVGIFLAARLIL